MILLILRGVPASGKSTEAAKLKQQGWTVVNRDDIRFTLYGRYWGTGVDEDVVTDVENTMIDSALRKNANVVLDATNLNNKALRTKLSIASRYGAFVNYREFPVGLEVALNRDANRDRKVGEQVLRGFFKRFKLDTVTGTLPPALDPLPKFERYVPNTDKVAAYIIDTDGTVANHEGVRNPYDTTRYHLDTVHNHVADVVAGIRAIDYAVIALSGRDAEFRNVTEKWWADNGIPFDVFHFRPEGDRRIDAVVKYELFKEHIEPHYNVLGAFDDRPQVIRMWEAIGVPTFRVGPGLEF